MRARAWQCFLCIPISIFFSVCSSAEPYQHPETGIIFPEQLAGLKKISVTDYEKDKPGLGISIGYGASSGTATIYLYNLGMKTVPEDIDGPHFRKHFEQVVGDVIRAGDNGPYHNVKKLSEEELVIGNSQTGKKALSASFSYVMVHNQKEVLSRIYLMSLNNHFLKVRFTYQKDMRNQGEGTLKQLIGELSMMITSDNLKSQANGNPLLYEKNVKGPSHVNSKAENNVIELNEFINSIEDYLGLNPDWKNEAWMVRAAAYMKTGSSDQLNALKSYSDGVDAAATSKYAEALVLYENAVRLDPLFPWSANNLAWVLSTCPDEKLRDGRRAIEFARQAIKVPKAEVPDFINTLAAAHAAAGDYDTAVRLCRKSVDMWPRDVFKEMLRCYLGKTLYIARGPSPRVGEFISAEGYGKAKWGMSKLDVIEVLPESAMQDNDALLARLESERGYRTTLILHFRYDMLYRVQVVASGIPESYIEPDFIKEASAGKGTFKKAEISGDADRTAAVWESDETRIEMLYSRSNSEAVMEFLSKRFELLLPTKPADRQNS